MRYTDIETDPTNGTFSGTMTAEDGCFSAFSARFDLFLIRQAWADGMDVEDLADGFGEGLGTMGGDWSGIRDSSDRATERMFERALNHIFGEGS